MRLSLCTGCNAACKEDRRATWFSLVYDVDPKAPEPIFAPAMGAMQASWDHRDSVAVLAGHGLDSPVKSIARVAREARVPTSALVCASSSLLLSRISASSSAGSALAAAVVTAG